VLPGAVNHTAAIVERRLAAAIELDRGVHQFVVEQRGPLRVADARVEPERSAQEDDEVERRQLTIEV
jgi:hypothetical protein